MSNSIAMISKYMHVLKRLSVVLMIYEEMCIVYGTRRFNFRRKSTAFCRPQTRPLFKVAFSLPIA